MQQSFYVLMESAYRAHQELHAAWKTYYIDKKRAEPAEVTAARDRFNIANDRLFDALIAYEKGFFAGEPKAINAVLNFLDIDVPAFRCGYAKEKFYRRLKTLDLDREQTERLKNIAYRQCGSNFYRREFRELTRLMITLADQEFMDRLSELARSSEGLVKFKADRMLQSILQNRKDLSSERAL